MFKAMSLRLSALLCLLHQTCVGFWSEFSRSFRPPSAITLSSQTKCSQQNTRTFRLSLLGPGAFSAFLRQRVGKCVLNL